MANFEDRAMSAPDSGGTADSGGRPGRVPVRPMTEAPAVVREPAAEAVQPAPQAVSSDGAAIIPQPPASSLSAVESGGDLILNGPMTVLAAGQDGKTALYETEKLTVSGVREYGEGWQVSGGEAAPGRRILLTGGTLAVSEDGSLLVTGVTGAVVLDMAPLSETAQVEYTGTIAAERPAGHPIFSALLCVGAVAAVLCVMQFLHRRKNGGEERPGPEYREAARPAPASGLAWGKVHQIGKRPSQQDSLTVEEVPGGVFAAVADGMGGLADGDKVSQTVIYTLLNAVSGRSAAEIGENLLSMVSEANGAVNQMLGFSARYKSGSTLVAAAADVDGFRWVSVGDSRIYLYRGGLLLRLNREHVFETDLLTQAVNREISFQEARTHPRRGGLTSFIGMGELRYVDRSPGTVSAARGDRLLLMSDGVYNTLPEEELTRILGAYPDASEAAAAVQAAVLERNNPHQDNFTAVILDYV